MCFNCGCGDPNDDMGHEDNITNQMLTKMAEQSGKDLHAMQHLVQDYLVTKPDTKDAELEVMFEKAAKAWGQSVEEAKKNTLSQLQREDHSH